MYYGTFARGLIRLIIIAFWISIIILVLQCASYFKGKFFEKSINILVWPQVLDAEFLKNFEKKAGVKINISYFSSNEELLVKLETSHEHSYDLVMPSHYMLGTLIEKGIIKPIDKTRLHFWKHIYPTLLGTYADPHNMYSVPFYWGILGLGVNTEFFKDQVIKPSWGLIFKEEYIKHCVSVVNDIRELSLIAAQYLFGRIHNLTDQEIQQVIELLVAQKKHVGFYTEGRAEYAIAAKSCPVGIVLLNDLLKVMKQFDSVDFIIPEEGTFVIVDSFVVSAQSAKDDLIYAFLNYLYSPEVLTRYTEKFQFLPVVDNVKTLFSFQDRFVPSERFFKQLHFLENVFPEKTLYKIWSAVHAQ